MKNPSVILRLLLLTLLIPVRFTEAQDKPNVIIVLADDMGIGDMTPSNPNCKIKTPNLQKSGGSGEKPCPTTVIDVPPACGPERG